MIAILLPVLGRPQAAATVVESIHSNTKAAHHVLFLCSPGDEEKIEACMRTGFDVHVVDWPAGAGDWARKINLGITLTSEPYILLGADDLRFHPNWDVEALRVADETQAGVIGTNDLSNPTVMKGKHATHPLVRRSYAEEYGSIDDPSKLLCEAYDHQFVDNELVETAMARRQWAFAADSHVEHLHPFFHKGEMDATYEKALSSSKEDFALYRRRRGLWRSRPPRNTWRRR